SGANGENYFLITRATDTAYNVESLQAERPFTIDSTTPTLTTIKPVSNTYYQKSSLVTISGTSVDLAGTNAGKFNNNPVNVCFKRIADEKYWDNIDKKWQGKTDLELLERWLPWSTANWTFYDVAVATAGYWSFEIAESSWTSGQQYMVWVGVNDQATNKIDYTEAQIQGGTGGVLFYCDNEAPVTDVQDPPNGSYLNDVSAPAAHIWGNCDEMPTKESPPYNAGNKYTYLKIKRDPTLGAEWFVSGAWVAGENWTEIIPWIDTWTYSGFNETKMTHGTTYWIYVYATDNAYPPPGNTESTGGNIKSLFLYDTQAGTSTISVPPTGEPHYKSLTTISGTCYDDFSSPDKVFVEIFDDTDATLYYSTNGWTTTQNYFETGGLQPWTTSWTTNIWTNHHRY
ncbi:MAG: hypothetical protein COT43_10210, partial [Candidatus Marinimicrobia bacterium CG08_land_8_20_14_0_20_45_22]